VNVIAESELPEHSLTNWTASHPHGDLIPSRAVLLIRYQQVRFQISIIGGSACGH